MNVKCSFCQTPYAIGRLEKLAALQHMETEKLSHYDAHCPRCRRATPVPRQKLEITFPNWRDALHELEQQTNALTTQPGVAADTHQAASTPKTESTPEPTHAKHRSRAGARAKEVARRAAVSPSKAKTTRKKTSA